MQQEAYEGALDRVDDLTDEALDDRVQLQDMLQQYEDILDTLRSEHEEGLADGTNLPSYEALTARFRSDKA